MFMPKEKETIEEIVVDFLIPGFMQNRLIASEQGPDFIQATRDLLIANVNYYVQTPAEADARNQEQMEAIVQAHHKVNTTYMDFFSKRMAKLAYAITEDGIDKHIKLEGSEEELDDEAKELVKKLRESGEFEDKKPYKLVKVEGPLSKMVAHWSAIAGGSEKFAMEQADVAAQMTEELKTKGEQVSVLACVIGAITAIATKRLCDHENFTFALDAVRDLMITTRDISVISAIASPAPVKTLFAMRASQTLSEILGPIPKPEGEGEEGCGNPDCDACNPPQDAAADNVIPFPASKTVH